MHSRTVHRHLSPQINQMTRVNKHKRPRDYKETPSPHREIKNPEQEFLYFNYRPYRKDQINKRLEKLKSKENTNEKSSQNDNETKGMSIVEEAMMAKSNRICVKDDISV